jgi:hypothetical protein
MQVVNIRKSIHLYNILYFSDDAAYHWLFCVMAMSGIAKVFAGETVEEGMTVLQL